MTWVMKDIKTYNIVNNQNQFTSFGISRMEDIYDKRSGAPDAPHRHDFYTTLLVQEGYGQHIIDFIEYPLENGQIFFISPGQVHQVIEKTRSVGYAIVFSTQFLFENNIPLCFLEDLHLFNDYGMAPPIALNTEDIQKFSAYGESIISYQKSNLKFKEHAIAATLKLLLIDSNNLCKAPNNTQNQEAGNTILRDFKAHVNQNFKKWHQASQYAEAMHITPDHLNRTIKLLIGKNAKEYIQSRIIIEAKRLLHFTQISAKEIGYDLGFTEPSNFSAFFKKCTGLSPSAFRNDR